MKRRASTAREASRNRAGFLPRRDLGATFVTLGLPLALATAGCASVPRPAELDDARTAMNAPETRELAALRPAMLTAAKEHFARAEQAFANGDAVRARQYAELVLQRVHAAENFVARDAATEQAKIMASRLADLGQEIDEDRDDLARLQALNSRLDRLTAAIGSAPSSPLEGARKALAAARARQAEAIGAGARSLARDRYEQGVALLEGSASALEMNLAQDSATASAGAVAAFTTAIGEAAAAKTAAAKGEEAKRMVDVGAAAAEANEAAMGRGAAAQAAGPGPAQARIAGGAQARAGGTSRIRELLHGAEDAKADAIGRGAGGSTAVAQGTYLLQLAREALAEGDEARATDKAREARQAFGSAGGGAAPVPAAPAPPPAKPAVAPAPAPAPAVAKGAVVEGSSARETQEREAAVQAIVNAQVELAAVVGRGHTDASVRKAQALIESAGDWLDRKGFARAKSFAEDAYKELKALPTHPPKPKPEPAEERPAPPPPPPPREAPRPAPPPASEPVASAAPPPPPERDWTAQRRAAELFADETIRAFRRAADTVSTDWETPYRKVIEALTLRDRASAAATTPAEKAAITIAGEKLAAARTAWEQGQLQVAAALAEAAITELAKVPLKAGGAAVPGPAQPGGQGGAGEPGGQGGTGAGEPSGQGGTGAGEPDGQGGTGAAGAAGSVVPASGSAVSVPGTDGDVYRKAESAVREAAVLAEVCEAEKCSERSVELHAAGKTALVSARGALNEKRFEYAVELAAEARKKLAAALEKPKPKPAAAPAAPVVDAAALKKQRSDADDAIREANVQRQVCEEKKCTGTNIEPKLRAESHLAAASAAYADGDYERAKTKAGEAHRILKAALDAQAAAPPPAPPPKPKGLVLPSDVSNVEIKGNQLLVSPAIQFTSGSATMTAASRKSLESLAKVLLHNKKRIRSISVVGYTDSRGLASLNVAISEKRAKAVADGLVAEGVSASIVSSKGRGPESPIADNETAEGRNLNRRVEVRVDLADDGS